MHDEAGEGCSIFSIDANFPDRRRLLNRIGPIGDTHKRAIDRSLDPAINIIST